MPEIKYSVNGVVCTTDCPNGMFNTNTQKIVKVGSGSCKVCDYYDKKTSNTLLKERVIVCKYKMDQ